MRRPILVLLCATLFSPAAPAAPDLSAKIAQTLEVERLPSSAESFVVLDPESGRVLASQSPNTPRSPASTIKTVTTFAALDMLGPAFVWHTLAFTRGTVRNGELDGDLILQGGGDPYMTLERWWSFAQALRAKGLKSIKGDIVIDNTAFSLPPEDPGAFDGKPNRPYNVLPDALMVNFQSVEFRLAADAGTRQVDIGVTPAPPNLIVDNKIRYAAGRCTGRSSRVDFKVDSARWDRVTFSGQLSPNCAERAVTRVLLTPTAYAFGTFVALWRELGGEISGRLRLEPAPSDQKPLLDFESLTLGEIIRLTNKYSSNLMARHLLLTIGAERYGVPATPAKGAQVLDEWGRERGLELQAINIDNGSGLSRETHISVMQMARVLTVAYKSRFAPEFMASLPLAGLDGTLRSRMKSSPAGSVRLKTGHIDGVSGVAGFVTGASGKTYVLVSLVNHARADYGAGEPVHAALVAWVQDNL
jgi:D-alanyl-D-alanine carboxypeptidase/D-alanyl-D-alanine-endopeptidase (penicillin-binding protein 4)